MLLYHASPINNLDEVGLQPGSTSTACRNSQPYVYLGSWRYIRTQYLRYCPPGRYYIYGVQVQGLFLDDSCVGEQWRTSSFIAPERITKFPISTYIKPVERGIVV